MECFGGTSTYCNERRLSPTIPRMDSRPRGRKLRQAVLDCIEGADLEGSLSELSQRAGARRLVRPATSLIGSEDEGIKSGAVNAMGWIVCELAQEDLEAARDVVRRLIWMLTEESGCIGWGAPEAIGEILARHERLANEFADNLLSFARTDYCVYLDHEPLQCDVLRGLRRLARFRPELVREKGIACCLRPHLASSDPEIAALAAEISGLLRLPA